MGTNLLPPAVTRGDVFALPEDDYLDYNLTVDFVTEEVPVTDPTELPTAPVLVETTPESKPNPEETLPEVPSTTPEVSDEPEELCSGKPFDAFTDLKNGSLYAFRGTLWDTWDMLPCWHPVLCLQSLALPLRLLSPQGSTSMSWTRPV